jgi:hypothetical protein
MATAGSRRRHKPAPHGRTHWNTCRIRRAPGQRGHAESSIPGSVLQHTGTLVGRNPRAGRAQTGAGYIFMMTCLAICHSLGRVPDGRVHVCVSQVPLRMSARVEAFDAHVKREQERIKALQLSVLQTCGRRYGSTMQQKFLAVHFNRCIS